MRWILTFLLLLVCCSFVVSAADEGLAQRGAAIEDDLARESENNSLVWLGLFCAIIYVILRYDGQLLKW